MKETDRRSVLRAVGAAGVGAGISGCIGGGEDDGGTAAAQDFPEFSASDPQFPQLWSTLIENDYQFGLEEDLEQMEERDEAYYGSSPPETPEDSSEWIDPDPIEFAYFPAENPAAYENSLDPLIQNIEEETGREVNYSAINSYASQIEAMRSERLHVAAYASASTAFAVNIAGFVPRAIQTAGGTFGYRLFAITQADNDEINSLEDFAGKNVAHSEQASNSGNLAPRALFEEVAGVVPGEDYEVQFSGSHENSGLGVYNGDYDAAPVCSTCVQRVVDDGRIDPDELKVVWASQPFPEGSFGYHYKLHPDIQEGFETAMFDYDYSGTSIPEEFNGRDTFLEIDYETVWNQNLVIMEANGVEFDVENV